VSGRKTTSDVADIQYNGCIDAVRHGLPRLSTETFVEARGGQTVASKGRELSIESAAAGGVVFTSAMVKVIAAERRRFDANQNGAIEISELYRGVKGEVTSSTRLMTVPQARAVSLCPSFWCPRTPMSARRSR
jgi:hypothetical protein